VVELPELDPAATELRPAGGFDSAALRVHSVEGGYERLRQSPALSGGPGAWLSASGRSGRVCTAHHEL